MEKQVFEKNRDKIINDFVRQLGQSHIARVLDALIIFEAITNGESTKIFNDKAIEAQHIFIEYAIQVGSYQPTISFT